jgi:hypothetical protein
MRAVFGLVMAAAPAACAQFPEPLPPAGSAAQDTVFSLAPGGRVNIPTGAPSTGAQSEAPGRDWPTFRVCRTDETPDGIILVIGPLDRVGPRHPDIRRIKVAPILEE